MILRRHCTGRAGVQSMRLVVCPEVCCSGEAWRSSSTPVRMPVCDFAPLLEKKPDANFSHPALLQHSTHQDFATTRQQLRPCWPARSRRVCFGRLAQAAATANRKGNTCGGCSCCRYPRLARQRRARLKPGAPGITSTPVHRKRTRTAAAPAYWATSVICNLIWSWKLRPSRRHLRENRIARFRFFGGCFAFYVGGP